jgi:hypothetical protein
MPFGKGLGDGIHLLHRRISPLPAYPKYGQGFLGMGPGYGENILEAHKGVRSLGNTPVPTAV